MSPFLGGRNQVLGVRKRLLPTKKGSLDSFLVGRNED